MKQFFSAHKKRLLIVVALLVLSTAGFFVWKHFYEVKPIIRFVEYRDEEVRILGHPEIAPYRFQNAVFRITNPTNHSFSYETIWRADGYEPFLALRTFTRGRKTITHPPMLDCGLTSTNIVELAPNSTVEFSVSMSGLVEPVNSFAVGLQFVNGNPADFAKSRARSTWTADILRILKHFLDRIQPDRVPGATWSDTVWITSNSDDP